MQNFINHLGVLIVLLGVICLVVYFCGVQKNFLLATSLVLELIGIGVYIFVNKRAQ